MKQGFQLRRSHYQLLPQTDGNDHFYTCSRLGFAAIIPDEQPSDTSQYDYIRFALHVQVETFSSMKDAQGFILFQEFYQALGAHLQ